DHARRFFSDLTYAHRGDGRLRNEERVRATVDSLSQVSEAAALLSGALDALESTLAIVRIKGIDPARDEADGGGDAVGDSEDAHDERERSADTEDALAEHMAALARRAGELRQELRFLLRAGDADYVYFVEFRGRGVFLRASPIDVSAIMRELVFERMTSTVLTSATLTVD